jgi:uncharacterized protein (TIGR02594 family)
MLRSAIAGAVALVLVLATGSALARISGSLGLDLVALARSQLGNGAIYGRHSHWCGRFVNWLLEHAGYHGTGSDAARSFLRFPRTSPQVGAIAVLYRKGGGHVGVVSGFDTRGNPVLISGNHGHRVYESAYPRSRVLAYVAPAKPAQQLADFRLGDAAQDRIQDRIQGRIHDRIIEFPPARARERPWRDGGGGEIAPGFVKLQERNRASRIDPRAEPSEGSTTPLPSGTLPPSDPGTREPTADGRADMERAL